MHNIWPQELCQYIVTICNQIFLNTEVRVGFRVRYERILKITFVAMNAQKQVSLGSTVLHIKISDKGVFTSKDF